MEAIFSSVSTIWTCNNNPLYGTVLGSVSHLMPTMSFCTASILDSDSDDDNTITINLNSDSDDEISDQPSGVETRDADGNLTTEYRAMLNTLQRRQERRERQLVNILQHRR